ncbi:helix-turn-helix transcriptional regulator [Streptomyces fulvoviolaceus]|uniref:helix-turn-helix transcriptional regulator n=1 Tax=Streptomyces fulvoviolaceus TaxID=285535 RepID=UPI0021C1CFE3|nr:LuxR C-terminal-related transcriptional regulator [Streptomyces fulvoviolaceus]MCT9080334.1 LuxR C-terminal-related transcriptional regulator [Streptomyces fulvoviolaceus]
MGTTAYERMLSVAVAALHERDPEQLWPLLASALPELCGGEALIYKLDNWDESEGALGLSPGVAAEFTVLGDEAASLLRAGYPLAEHYANSPDRAPVTARRVAGRSWSASPTARLIDDILDVDHVLGIPLPQSTAPITGCLVYRSGRDFSDDEMRLAQQFQPLLAAVEQQRQLLERWRQLRAPHTSDGPAPELTPRETTVLLLLSDALTAVSIGRRLGISERTVHKHIANIYRKLGTHDRISTVLRAQRLGLVPAVHEPSGV